jgi:murein DD-endopeptidase MepM/ murein hydrolase activator NlpD
LLGVAASVYLLTRQLEKAAASPYPISRAPGFKSALVGLPVWQGRGDETLEGLDLPLEIAFQRGETLGKVLKGLGLEPTEAQSMLVELSQHVNVRRLRPQDRYAALVDDDGRLQGLRVTLDGKGRAEVRREGDSWRSSWSEFTEVVETQVIQGVLAGSLESSILGAGGEAVVAYVMADVLQWDLDFNRDLRVGDRFEVLYEKIYLNGDFHRVGSVLALSYSNDDRLLEAYQFGEDAGHYDGNGRPLRKLFLKSPLRYSRVTSGFSSRRFHPVSKSYRPHYGVDYGAPVGTPVRVTGSGVVQSAGWDRGGGKTVKVRHPNGYLTAYLHLSRFAEGVRAGARVGQGEVIGFVGTTGVSTGPHLDYRMQKGGRWINPQAFKSEPAPPIPPDRQQEFETVRNRWRHALTTGEPVEPVHAAAGQQIADLEPLRSQGGRADVD